MKYKKVLSKSLKINFFRYISFIVSSGCAIMINFIYSTVILNSYILNNNESTFINYIVSFSVIYIMMSIGIFIVYSYDNYMKWRTNEFTAFIILGITKKELKRLLLIESFLLLTTALVLGTFLGVIFSKIFFLSIVKFCELKNVFFQITYKNYLNVLVLFFWIFMLMIYKVCRISKFLDVKEIMKYKNKPMSIKRKNGKVKVLISILIACIIYKKMSATFSKSMEFYVTNIFISMAVVYLSLNPSIWFINKLIKRIKFGIYIKMKSMKSAFHTGRKLTLILTFLSFMIISYVRINYIYNLRYKTMGNLLVMSKVNFMSFIYIFTTLLCFIIFSTTIFFNTSFNIPMMKRLYNSLFIIGITKNEFKKLIKFKLYAAFFEPLILSLLMSAVYIEISNLKFQFSFGTVLIYLVYFLLLLIGYFSAERKYNEEIFK